MTPLNDQDRLTMQRQAATAERRNSPRSLIVLATLVLLVAGAYAGLGFTKRKASLRTLASAQFTQQNVQAQLEQLRQLRNPQGEDDGPVIYDRILNPLSLLEQSARNAEIDPPPYDSERSVEETSSAHRRVFTFRRFMAADAGEIVRWASMVEKDIEGMRVHRLQLEASNDRRGWNVNISFSRLEKKQ